MLRFHPSMPLQLGLCLILPQWWSLLTWPLPSRLDPVCLGLCSGVIFGFVTGYYTSFCYQPACDITKQQESSAATGKFWCAHHSWHVWRCSWCTWKLPESFHNGGGYRHGHSHQGLIGSLLWLCAGWIFEFVTEYFTPFSYQPVCDITKQRETGAATGMFFGLAVDYLSRTNPVICIAGTILVAHTTLGMLGVVLGALGMLTTIAWVMQLMRTDKSNYNGGVANMSGHSHDVRTIIDALDAAAVGMGFAIGSTALPTLRPSVLAQPVLVSAQSMPWSHGTPLARLIGAIIP